MQETILVTDNNSTKTSTVKINFCPHNNIVILLFGHERDYYDNVYNAYDYSDLVCKISYSHSLFLLEIIRQKHSQRHVKLIIILFLS